MYKIVLDIDVGGANLIVRVRVARPISSLDRRTNSQIVSVFDATYSSYFSLIGLLLCFPVCLSSYHIYYVVLLY